MEEIRYDRSPSITIIKHAWARAILPNIGHNKTYQKIKEVKKHLLLKVADHPGVTQRNPTLTEFCNYFNLPVNDCVILLNNRFHTRFKTIDE